jgi:hypothetical protein
MTIFLARFFFSLGICTPSKLTLNYDMTTGYQEIFFWHYEWLIFALVENSGHGTDVTTNKPPKPA